jgi:hypothetical protein
MGRAPEPAPLCEPPSRPRGNGVVRPDLNLRCAAVEAPRRAWYALIRAGPAKRADNRDAGNFAGYDAAPPAHGTAGFGEACAAAAAMPGGERLDPLSS